MNTTLYAGLDIAKHNLQLHWAGRSYDLPNTPAGHRHLIHRLRPQPGAQALCEATGGSERDGVTALHQAGLPVSLLNPARVRHFARAQGPHAQTDRLDAAVLTAYGQALTLPNLRPQARSLVRRLAAGHPTDRSPIPTPAPARSGPG